MVPLKEWWWFPIDSPLIPLHYCMSNHSSAICHRMSPTVKSRWGGSLWGKMWGRKGLTNESQILIRSVRDMGLSYAKEIILTTSAV